MNRNRIHIYLGDDAHRVKQEAKRQGMSISRLAHIALVAFLENDEDKREAVLMLRIDQMIRKLKKIEEGVSVSSESLALFIQYELAIKPPMPVLDTTATKSKANERFSQFIKRVASRVANGKTLLNDVREEISVTQDDFYQMDLEEDGDEDEQK